MGKIIKKKSLGQNFLHDKKIIQSIVDASPATKDNLIVEIGPGDGSLTEEILSRGHKLLAIEIDERMIGFLKKRFENEIKQGQLQLLHQDILDWEAIKEPYNIIANIPYYMTGAIIRKLLSVENQPKSMTLVMQKEVVERIVKKDNKGSILSNSVMVYGTPKLVRTIGKGAFSPPPDVESAVLVISDISRNMFTSKEHEENFFKIMKMGFSHKRKKLLSNIKEYKKEEIFDEIGISKDIRAEELSTKEWLYLTK